ncbi:peptidase [Methylorubrum populi]|uniref:Peptidase n=1 Tax=Methylobacterium radiotolerans TaxID=31998 RepID=A0ABU7TBI5_9HYPH
MKRPTGAGLLSGLRRLGLRDLREPGPVSHISLGSHCHTAQILKGLGLRTWSAPFDWIFSSPGMVRDCLADDFSDLLDRRHYESTPVGERVAPDETRCRHRLYRDRHAIPFVFNHHDPATSEEDYRFLLEGVRRLRVALARPGARNALYLLTALPTEPETVRAIRDGLAARAATAGAENHLTMITLRQGEEPSVQRLAREPHLDWLEVTTRSPSVGLRFADPADDAFVKGLLPLARRFGGEP